MARRRIPNRLAATSAAASLYVALLCLPGCGGSDETPRSKLDTGAADASADGSNLPESEVIQNASPAKPGADKQTDSPNRSEDANPPPAVVTATQQAFEFDDGAIQFAVSDSAEPSHVLPGNFISERTSELWLHVLSKRRKGTRIYTEFAADEVVGLAKGKSFFQDFKLLIEDESWRVRLRFPKAGLQPGTYTVQVWVEGGERRVIPLSVEPIAALPIRASDRPPPAGFNVSSHALGGQIRTYTGQTNDSNWAAQNLIDGFAQIYARNGSQVSSGWSADISSEDPAEVVFTFHEGGLARIGAIVFAPIVEITDTDLLNIGENETIIPKHVEVWISDDTEGATYTRVAETRLYNIVEWQWIPIDDVPARFVKLRFLSNHGEPRVGLGEVMILEAGDASDSILADFEMNLAAPALGGGIVSLTSQDKDSNVSRLFDGGLEPDESWQSAQTELHGPEYLPQTFVFSFLGRRTAYVDRVELRPTRVMQDGEAVPSDTSPSMVAISTAVDSAGDYDDLTKVHLPHSGEPLTVSVGRDAQLVRIQLLDNFGGPSTRLGELAVLEGKRNGYVSLLHDQTRSAALHRDRRAAAVTSDGLDPDDNEPNDQVSQATSLPLDMPLAGNLHEREDVDYFGLTIAGEDPQALTLALRGQPSIRTALELRNSAGEAERTFVPSGDIGQSLQLTWQIDPGEHVVRVYRPPTNLVVIWDTSGSMEGRIADLEAAVRQFLSGVVPGETVQLIRFSDEPSVVLDDFMDDGPAIVDALSGQFNALGSTALIDAVNAGLHELAEKPGRNYIVVFTDGQDTASQAFEGDLFARLSLSHLGVYAIGLGSDLSNYSQRTGSTGHQFLRALADATHGQYFFARDTTALPAIFAEIAADLRALPKYTIQASASDTPGLLTVQSVGEYIPALSPPSLELILDASGSMKRQVSGGRTRMQVAKQVLADLVQEIPEGVPVGLRVFGHRIAEGQQGDCEDTEALVPVAPLRHTQMQERIERVQPLGTTLIARALEMSAAAHKQGDARQVVVLVTDGEEECRDDLAATVDRIRESGVDLTLNVVGFTLDDPAVQAEMSRVANIGGGQFISALGAHELEVAMRRALDARFQVQDSSGRSVGMGTVNGAAVPLSSGIYNVVIESTHSDQLVDGVRIEVGRTTTVVLDRRGQEVASGWSIE